MIKLTVMYPNTEDLEFDKKYYTTEHSQLLSELLGDAVKTSDINVGLTGASPAQLAPYVVIANLTSESLESFQQSFGVNAEKILADLPNFTNVKPVVQISEVL
ncbi:EthD family reductase [Arenibacter sp. BSSL-BM3]|uniref:EthD family reductase n=1 Tax=Arenibacter arenosicollis TaxID=2762274 RepID=A0ABR7QNN8_9FLAO|nr:EthD family reductase [Arenibacter arenosicollis]MBC8768805.1 EthD family reductase [Arenibacter arenosicollis]